MSPSAFERLAQRILREPGFIQVAVTGSSRSSWLSTPWFFSLICPLTSLGDLLRIYATNVLGGGSQRPNTAAGGLQSPYCLRYVPRPRESIRHLCALILPVGHRKLLFGETLRPRRPYR